MAEHCYGYGGWDAPFCFMGLEEGMDDKENGDLTLRAKAWRKGRSCELSDCRRFHRDIGVLQWHQERPPLQQTWRPLILLLLTLLDLPSEESDLREYQKSQWGIVTGESCVIELSGFPAKSLGMLRERERFLPARINVIKQRINEQRPILVLMYGKTRKKEWEQIANVKFPDDRIDDFTAAISKVGVTTFVFSPHPQTRKLTNSYWVKLGLKLRGELDLSSRTRQPLKAFGCP
ncbi:MAG TPA: hypothetical protein VGM02_16280 [Acidobacteriaceae bacterium]